MEALLTITPTTILIAFVEFIVFIFFIKSLFYPNFEGTVTHIEKTFDERNGENITLFIVEDKNFNDICFCYYNHGCMVELNKKVKVYYNAFSPFDINKLDRLAKDSPIRTSCKLCYEILGVNKL